MSTRGLDLRIAVIASAPDDAIGSEYPLHSRDELILRLQEWVAETVSREVPGEFLCSSITAIKEIGDEDRPEGP